MASSFVRRKSVRRYAHGVQLAIHPDRLIWVYQRVHAARERINALNPRVEVIAATNMQDLRDEEALQAYDLVVLTDSHRITIVGLTFRPLL